MSDIPPPLPPLPREDIDPCEFESLPWVQTSDTPETYVCEIKPGESYILVKASTCDCCDLWVSALSQGINHQRIMQLCPFPIPRDDAANRAYSMVYQLPLLPTINDRKPCQQEHP